MCPPTAAGFGGTSRSSAPQVATLGGAGWGMPKSNNVSPATAAATPARQTTSIKGQLKCTAQLAVAKQQMSGAAPASAVPQIPSVSPGEMRKVQALWKARKTFGLEAARLRDVTAVVDECGAGVWG